MGNFEPSDLLRATLVTLPLHELSTGPFIDLVNQYLSSEEHDHLASLSHFARRQSYAAGRLAAKLAIRQQNEGISPSLITVRSGIFQQPIVYSENINIQNSAISIAHSERLAAALCFHRAHPMGIDCDRTIASDAEEILRNLHPKLLASLATLKLHEGDAATLFWVAQESLAKTLTTGLMSPTATYRPSEIRLENGCYHVRHEYFEQYQTIVIPGAEDWLAITLPARTQLDVTPLTRA